MATNAAHRYGAEFYEYINSGSLASARVVCPIVHRMLQPASLLDVGCGAGAWCKVWSEIGVCDVVGIDGAYVDRNALLIDSEQFLAFDLSYPIDLGRRFDLVMSLEVAEHIPEPNAEEFIRTLVRHSDFVLFSAAVPGQGGEFHVNERPLSYWRELFALYGMRCFDPVRPLILGNRLVEPWYRFNTLLYVAAQRVNDLPADVRNTEVPAGAPIVDLSPVFWRARNAIIRMLPRFLKDGLVKLKHAWMRRNA